MIDAQYPPNFMHFIFKFCAIATHALNYSVRAYDGKFMVIVSYWLSMHNLFLYNKEFLMHDLHNVSNVFRLNRFIVALDCWRNFDSKCVCVHCFAYLLIIMYNLFWKRKNAAICRSLFMCQYGFVCLQASEGFSTYTRLEWRRRCLNNFSVSLKQVKIRWFKKKVLRSSTDSPYVNLKSNAEIIICIRSKCSMLCT